MDWIESSSLSSSVSSKGISASSSRVLFGESFLGRTGLTRRLVRAANLHVSRRLTQREQGWVPSHFNLDLEQDSQALEALLWAARG